MGGRIVIMGSGETAPTMVKVHRALIEQAGEGARAMLDTPFGFQANADDLTEKVQEYFTQSVGVPLEVARWRRRDEPTAERERTLALLRRASWAFAGPGSPSYALRQWEDTPLPRALVDVVGRGGTVVLGSAAAVTVGSHSVPVYEIYKVGDDPRWLAGLDLLGELTGHPGRRHPAFRQPRGRSSRHPLLLPRRAAAGGHGGRTALRRRGDRGRRAHRRGHRRRRAGGHRPRRRRHDAALPRRGRVRAGGVDRPDRPGRHPQRRAARPRGDQSRSRLRGGARSAGSRRRFRSGRPRPSCAPVSSGAWPSRTPTARWRACLDLEEAIHAWSADTLQSDDIDVARQALRAMLVDLAGAAVLGPARRAHGAGPGRPGRPRRAAAGAGGARLCLERRHPRRPGGGRNRRARHPRRHGIGRSDQMADARVGLLAYGAIGHEHNLAVQATPGLTLTAVCDTNPDRVAAALELAPEAVAFDGRDGHARLGPHRPRRRLDSAQQPPCVGEGGAGPGYPRDPREADGPHGRRVR